MTSHDLWSAASLARPHSIGTGARCLAFEALVNKDPPETASFATSSTDWDNNSGSDRIGLASEAALHDTPYPRPMNGIFVAITVMN